MTTTNNHTATESAICCGACETNNHAHAKFCKSCGQSLSEPCAGCGKSVLLTQRFCGACGADLQEALEKIHRQHEQWSRSAVAAAKEFDFDHSISLLKRVSLLTDYRFKEASEAATKAIEKIEKMRDRAIGSAEQAMAQAEIERSRGNHQEVVRLLQQVPEKLLSPAVKSARDSARAQISEMAELENGLRTAIAENNWIRVGNLLGQLLVAAPAEKKYLKLSEQVAAKLIARSKKQFACGKYTEALRQLSAIPGAHASDEVAALEQCYEDADWLSRQSDLEPFATPLLGRLAVRYAKQVPSDPRARQQATSLAARLKQQRPDPRNPFPDWTAATVGWLGGRVGLLDTPVSIPQSEPNLLKPCVGGYHVAIGLALQGLGQGRVSESLLPKKGFLASLTKRKETTCWGIDIGTTSLKAVQLAQVDDDIEIVDAYFEEFPEPVSIDRQADDASSLVIETAVENLIDEKDLEGTPVWANISSSDFINRFRRLPPLPDKRANAVLESEIGSQMPIPMEDVFAVRWIGPLDTSHARGRPAVVSAAKRIIVQDRLELLSEAGLNVAGLQTDSVAIVNFAAYEFADILHVEEDENEEEQDDGSGEAPIANENEAGLPTVAIVECGAATTSLILVSGETHWYRTIASGGEDLTTALSRTTQSSRAEAEKLKRNPAAIEFPSKQYAIVEQRLDSIRSRLQWMSSEAAKDGTYFDVVETWCVGGGFLAHQSIRRLMLIQHATQEHL